jgi:GNAT superfamily N-acetyltransferase
MVGHLRPVRFDPVSADRDDWARYHELRHIKHAELHPDDPMEPDEIVEARMKKPDAFDRRHWFEMSRDGVVISTFGCEHTLPSNPEHETNKHLMWGEIYVRPEERRKHVGASWLPVIVDLMREHGCTVFGSDADRESGHAFSRWAGAEPKLEEIESRLNLAEVDWDMMRRWVEEGQRRSPETRLETYDGPLPEAMWPDFAKQRSALLNTMPFEGLEIGEIIITPDRIRQHQEQAAAARIVDHEVLTREPDGSISAMTDVNWAPYRRTHIEQQFTGVRPDARGRGLGKWIKAAMAIHVHELYPDAQWISTGNAGSNAPMLKINRTMGFKPYRTAVSYQVARDRLEERARNL